MAKPTRQEYLVQQAKKLPADQQKAALAQISAAAKGGVSKEELTKLDAQFNTTLYGVTGLGGTAGAAPWIQTGQVGTPAPANIPNPLAEAQAAERRSAYAILTDAFKGYGLEALVSEIQNYMTQDISPEEARIRIKETEPYKQRFAGNQGRIAKGLEAYTPAEYLQAEETYRNLLAANGLEGIANKDTYGKLIGGAVSPVEAQERIAKVFAKIDNADAAVKEQLTNYFGQYGVADPNIQRTELATALLTGDVTAQNLQRNLQKAYLRAGAALAKVNVQEPNIEELQRQLETAGVSDVYGAARAGFETLAQLEPTTTKLAQIYGEETPSIQSELQQEAFLGLKSQRRKKLEQQEQAAFAGQAGTTQVSLGQASAGTF